MDTNHCLVRMLHGGMFLCLSLYHKKVQDLVWGLVLRSIRLWRENYKQCTFFHHWSWSQISIGFWYENFKHWSILIFTTLVSGSTWIWLENWFEEVQDFDVRTTNNILAFYHWFQRNFWFDVRIANNGLSFYHSCYKKVQYLTWEF